MRAFVLARYGDVKYMEALAIPGTAITASDPPVDGFRIHGIPLPAEDDGSADVVFDTFEAIGIDVDRTALEMEESVVSAFTDAFDQLVAGVARKASQDSHSR